MIQRKEFWSLVFLSFLGHNFIISSQLPNRPRNSKFINWVTGFSKNGLFLTKFRAKK